jgi:TrmH family RNA methyltransferase
MDKYQLKINESDLYAYAKHFFNFERRGIEEIIDNLVIEQNSLKSDLQILDNNDEYSLGDKMAIAKQYEDKIAFLDDCIKSMNAKYSDVTYRQGIVEKLSAEDMINDIVKRGYERFVMLDRYKDRDVVKPDKAVSRLSPKENCLVIGVFGKYECELETNTPHTALQNPGNMGNLGTIIRTMLGFGIHDLAIIGSGADILDPKVVRASMGAVFRIRFAHFDTIESYAEKFGGHDLYPFMLDGELTLSELPEREDKPFTLIFGNEAAGLDEHYRKIGKSVVIKHSGEIDSLNLSIAAGIAFYEFTKRR